MTARRQTASGQDAWWQSWSSLRQLADGKKIILWGRSEDWVPKTVGKLPHEAAYVVDRNEGYTGEVFFGLEVRLPSEIEKEDRDASYIVVTAGPYEGIVATLLDRGYEPGKHFCCCPEFKDYQLLESMRNYDQSVLVSCSDYLDETKARYSPAGGGIYRYQIGPNRLERMAAGCFRQLQIHDGHYYAVEYVDMHVYVFDRDFQVVEKRPLDHPNYCGLSIDPKRNVFVLINAAYDTISIHDAHDFKLVERYNFSEKFKDGVTSNHHLNDCCISGDYLYVSYFSHSGTWKKGNHDGGISEFHMDRIGAGGQELVRGLWKPHSPEIIDGNLCYLDSMRGRLHTDNQYIAGVFSGFVRGLTHDGRFYYVGQSEDMYMSRVFGTRDSIMLNAGFYMFDAETKASRFYPMLDNMNIHDLALPISAG